MRAGSEPDRLPVAATLAARPDTAAPLSVLDAPFIASQLRNSRVLNARLEARFAVRQMFHQRGIRYPAAQLFMRVFKRERALEVWVRPDGTQTFQLLKTYPICALAGEVGPKRVRGDGQTPEGFYFIDSFNPASQYHLSLHVDYPNTSDRALGTAGNLGGDIYIHGGCLTEGCIAVTDAAIQELYWLAVETRAAGQAAIPVHIFPARLNDDELDLLRNGFRNRPDLVSFWESLRPGYDYFEQHRQLPPVRVGPRGLYQLLGTNGSR
jgi:murein L,D-transpeptidase YafK